MNENPYASPKSVEEETKKSFSALDVAYNLVVWTSPTFFFGLVVIQLCYEQSAMPWSVRVPNEWLFAAIWLVSQMAVLNTGKFLVARRCRTRAIDQFDYSRGTR
jgi:hypothetical protein